MFNSLASHLNHVMAYFAARKQEQGGFSQAPSLPATVEDTYYALRSLALLRAAGLPVEERLFKGHRRFLAARLREAALGERMLYQAAWCSSFLGLNGLVDEALARARRAACSRDLHALFYRRRMEKLAGTRLPGGREPENAWTKGVREVRMYLSLKGAGPSNPLKEEWRGWLLSCQNGDGGFGFMPGTTSYMENCYHAMRAMARLGMRPLDCRGLRGFVTAAKSGRGGFGRGHTGVPLPSSTWHALACLWFLDRDCSW